jgi:protein-L-isoaspartate(D-aspartate) O-methyltransferase
MMKAALTVLALLLTPLSSACAQSREKDPESGFDHYSAERERMVRSISGYADRIGESADPAILEAIGSVPRHLLVPAEVRAEAYKDHPLPIGHSQTISQPSLVALMTHLLRPDPDDVVLEVGTGSGYQAAILSRLVHRVFTIEIVEPLAERARRSLAELGTGNVEVRHGDGYLGWPEHAPFDAIIVTAGADHVPEPLIDQLKPGGHMVIPVGPRDAVQQLRVITKDEKGKVTEEIVSWVRFVPLTRPDD